MPPRSYALFSILHVLLQSHSLTALWLQGNEANALTRSASQNQMSCKIMDFIEFPDFLEYAPKNCPWWPNCSIRHYSMSDLYKPPEGLKHKNWAPSSWASQSSTKSQTETYEWKTAAGAGVGDFNQYLLEQVMLAKWQGSGKCCTAEKGNCAGNEEVIIYPSFILHFHMEFGYNWHMLWQDSLHGEVIYEYWNAIYTRHWKKGRKPTIVIHMSYTWDSKLSIEFLKVLSLRFPKQFVEHIVIGGLESDMRFNDRKHMKDLPTLVALPYPVGIVNAVHFTSRDGSGFDPNRDRPITITFEGDWSRDRDGGNIARPHVHSKLEKYIGKSSPHVHVCRESNARTDAQHICGQEMTRGFESSLNSVFCLEPPGDTLTRSHLYVAVLTGCVPVIFDGGHTSYGPHETAWAWRKTNASQSSRSVDYNSFAVVYHMDAMKDVDWVQDLIDMPVKNPDRLLQLRRGLDNVAPLMRYSPEANRNDAFDAFVTEIEDIRLSHH
mmetsp:Transcript_42213/g.121256  ORF Transcript_42213/g.121256 Transcript_42213/m.121256 type:complete len:493 (-) Transcript_42213:82-1560(-)